jgi:hypothetical protein
MAHNGTGDRSINAHAMRGKPCVNVRTCCVSCPKWVGDAPCCDGHQCQMDGSYAAVGKVGPEHVCKVVWYPICCSVIHCRADTVLGNRLLHNRHAQANGGSVLLTPCRTVTHNTNLALVDRLKY